MSTNCFDLLNYKKKRIYGFNLNGSVLIKLPLLKRLFQVKLWPWPWITIGIFLSLYQVIRSLSFRFSLPTMYPVTISYYVTGQPWAMTSDLDKRKAFSSHDGDQLYQVVWTWSLWFILYTAYKGFLLVDNTTMTLWPRTLKTIGIFLSS